MPRKTNATTATTPEVPFTTAENKLIADNTGLTVPEVAEQTAIVVGDTDKDRRRRILIRKLHALLAAAA